jgi:hypothetical protein
MTGYESCLSACKEAELLWVSWEAFPIGPNTNVFQRLI